MHTHKSVSCLRFLRAGTHYYLEVGFQIDAHDQSLEHPGVQWLTIQRNTDEETSAVLPREVTRESVFRIGGVRRQIEIKIDPSCPGRRWLGLSIASNSPYCIQRHTRKEDGGVKVEQVFPFPLDPEDPPPHSLVDL